ncbi:hypothetical protein P7K49_025204 [Saguinus oedipus]|uniref:Uncharacterized protein n=1 Tax=Saguinus oedipus TaxID=9490 RepID=A0ABQ9UGK0_SAGOE|nr:hypothetical protein P7K49_025204 [Saguinus oedipus]
MTFQQAEGNFSPEEAAAPPVALGTGILDLAEGTEAASSKEKPISDKVINTRKYEERETMQLVIHTAIAHNHRDQGETTDGTEHLLKTWPLSCVASPLPCNRGPYIICAFP